MAQVFNASTNPTLPSVAIVIGGKERPMAFCYKAIAALEGKHQQSVGELLGKVDRLSLATDLLHAALWRDDQTLTVEQVSTWVTFHNLRPIQDALLATWFGSLPDKDESSGEAEAQATEA